MWFWFFYANVLIGLGKLNTWKPPYISESLNQEESVTMNQSLGFISVLLQLLAHTINLQYTGDRGKWIAVYSWPA